MKKNDNTNQIIKDYLNGISNKELSEKYGLHRVSIQRLLKRNNVSLRLKENNRKHKIDFNLFKEIDTEFKAYFFGLVYADGNLFRNCIDITLIDKQILEDISLMVYGKIVLGERKAKTVNFKQKKYNQKKQYRFLITCKEIVNDLKKYGLHENKGYTIRLPNIKKELIRHFIRGYMDGDGCVFLDFKYNKNHRATLVSNKKFCNDIKKIVEDKINITSYIKPKKGKMFDFIIYGKNQVLLFLDWIYNDSTIRLERKYKKYLELKTYEKTNSVNRI